MGSGLQNFGYVKIQVVTLLELTVEGIKYNSRNIYTEIKTKSFHYQRQMFTSTSISQK